MTRKQILSKRRLERLLKRHGYAQDSRPDHREWRRYSTSFNTQIRLDQNNPSGWNGFELMITTYTRWQITPKQLDSLLGFLKKEFP
jgi:hypothetical protein